MVERVPERSGGNLNIQLAFRKIDQAGTAGRALIAEVQSHAEKGPSAGMVGIIVKDFPPNAVTSSKH